MKAKFRKFINGAKYAVSISLTLGVASFGLISTGFSVLSKL